MFQRLPFNLLLFFFLCANQVFASTQWNTTKNDLKTAASVSYNDNLYHQPDKPITVFSSQVNLAYDYLGLFEGYGVNLPINISHTSFSNGSDLSHFDYKFAPSIRLFLAEYSDLTIHADTSQNRKINGENGAEFLASSLPYVDEVLNKGSINLRLGRAPSKQYVDVRAVVLVREQNYQNISINEIKSHTLFSQYGYKVNEDSYALIDARYKQEQRAGLDFDLIELGLGFYTLLGGSHQLLFELGYFERSGDQKGDGYYWNLSDKWRLSETTLLTIRSNQQSEVSLAQDTFTQLTKNNEIILDYQINDVHQLSVSLAQKDQQFDSTNGYYTRLTGQVTWRWNIFDGFNAGINFARENVESDKFIEQVSQNKVMLDLEYIW